MGRLECFLCGAPEARRHGPACAEQVKVTGFARCSGCRATKGFR